MSLSRRKFVQDSAAFASLASLSPLRLGNAQTPPAGGNKPLYIIVQGPWLFNVPDHTPGDPFTINALTVSAPPTPGPMPHPMPHKYHYIDPRAPLDGNNDLPIKGDIPHNQPVDIIVNGLAKTRPSASALFKQMKNDEIGIFYDKSVRSFPQSAEYQLNLPSPDQILPLGMIKGATVQMAGKCLKGWPSALAFVYSNWSSYSASPLKDPIDSSSLQAPFAVRLFRIAHTDPVSPAKEYEHATAYFGKLVKQVCGSGCSLPTVQFPTAPAEASIDLGALTGGDLSCLDLGDPRLCGMKKVLSNGRIISATLVNCASGVGGVGGRGCC